MPYDYFWILDARKLPLALYSRAFCYSDAKLWNSLPKDIRFCDLLPLFKTKLMLTSTRHPRVRHTRNIKLGLVYPLWRLKLEFRTSLKGMMTIPFLLRKVWLMKQWYSKPSGLGWYSNYLWGKLTEFIPSAFPAPFSWCHDI